MDQHAVPRQITTFEFKLIGVLTLRQFGYLAIFLAISVILFYLVPIPILNILLAAVCTVAGVVVVFVPYNDRPIDIWIKNFIKKLFSPSQYYFIKRNASPDFLKGVFAYATSQTIETHIEARQKLSAYLQTTAIKAPQDSRKQEIHNLISSSSKIAPPQVRETPTEEDSLPPSPITISSPEEKPTSPKTEVLSSQPFLYGVVKNSKETPLPNVLVYIKDANGAIRRILKTNQNGVFATFHKLPSNSYSLEAKDLGQRYFFDTMEYNVVAKNDQPIYFISKEQL